MTDIGPLVPLMQTLAWIGLILFLVLRYGVFLNKLLKIVEQRIEGGSSFKFGQLEFGQAIESQSIENQKAKADEETQEYLEANVGSSESLESNGPKVRSDSFLAEDLALRALQEVSGEFIERHAQISPELLVDGVLERSGRYTLIEVKLVTNASVHQIAQKAIARLTSPIVRNSWPDVSVMICLIFNDSDPTAADTVALNLLIKNAPVDVEYVIFRLDELRERFGIDE